LPEPGVRLGVLKLHGLLIVQRRHRNASVDCREDCSPSRGIDPVAQRIELPSVRRVATRLA
jgi:hypothetical protein